mmetsp:Transcript_19266/g.49295  ORF Transcript_19266/g.49295 Transcript_19266/m.49295 type:complete len:247 (+) Transcript_19266:373-1113(+)
MTGSAASAAEGNSICISHFATMPMGHGASRAISDATGPGQIDRTTSGDRRASSCEKVVSSSLEYAYRSITLKIVDSGGTKPNGVMPSRSASANVPACVCGAFAIPISFASIRPLCVSKEASLCSSEETFTTCASDISTPLRSKRRVRYAVPRKLTPKARSKPSVVSPCAIGTMPALLIRASSLTPSAASSSTHCSMAVKLLNSKPLRGLCTENSTRGGRTPKDLVPTENSACAPQKDCLTAKAAHL